MSPRISRRSAIELLLGLGLVAAAPGCRAPGANAGASPDPALPKETGSDRVPPAPYADNVDALCDVILPAERDADGNVTSPGAREAGADEVLRIASFVPLAQAQGLLPPLSDDAMKRLGNLDAPFRDSLNLALDAAAAVQKPLTRFRDLPRALQEAAVDSAFADPAQKPAMLVVRAACMTAYLGAFASDVGLRAIGFPPFEKFADGLAVSGYPRTRAGRLVDPTSEDLGALAASGDLDDYTFNEAPAPTAGDDLSKVIDANGDLL